MKTPEEAIMMYVRKLDYELFDEPNPDMGYMNWLIRRIVKMEEYKKALENA